MAIDTSSEKLIALNEVASLIPGHPHLKTIYRWRLHPVRGRKLETVLVGGRAYTSREALERFLTETEPPLLVKAAQPA